MCSRVFARWLPKRLLTRLETWKSARHCSLRDDSMGILEQRCGASPTISAMSSSGVGSPIPRGITHSRTNSSRARIREGSTQRARWCGVSDNLHIHIAMEEGDHGSDTRGGMRCRCHTTVARAITCQRRLSRTRGPRCARRIFAAAMGNLPKELRKRTPIPHAGELLQGELLINHLGNHLLHWTTPGDICRDTCKEHEKPGKPRPDAGVTDSRTQRRQAFVPCKSAKTCAPCCHTTT